MTHLDLFSGIGGFALGLRMAGGFESVAFCESDKFCQQVLNKHWPDVPIFDDIKTLKGTDVGTIGIVTGGAPCQPFSVAGKQGGTADDRYLWPEMFRVIKETNPNWVIFENVSGIVNMALEQVLSDLESEGYGTETFIVPACGVNAPHRRNRVWVVANPNSQWEQQQGIVHRQEREWIGNGSHSMADATGQGWRFEGSTGKEVSQSGSIQRPARCSSTMANANIEHGDHERPGTSTVCGELWQETKLQRCGNRKSEPGLGREIARLPCGMDGHFTDPWNGDWEGNTPRVSRGVPNRANRLKALGNSVVPQIVAEIGRIIQLVESNHDR